MCGWVVKELDDKTILWNRILILLEDELATVKHQFPNSSGKCVLDQVALALVGKWHYSLISEYAFLGLEVTYYSAEELMARQSVCVHTLSG